MKLVGYSRIIIVGILCLVTGWSALHIASSGQMSPRSTSFRDSDGTLVSLDSKVMQEAFRRVIVEKDVSWWQLRKRSLSNYEVSVRKNPYRQNILLVSFWYPSGGDVNNSPSNFGYDIETKRWLSVDQMMTMPQYEQK